MKLSHLYDVITFIHGHIADEEVGYLENKELNGKGQDVLKQVVSQAQVPKNVISWRAVLGKVGRIKAANLRRAQAGQSLWQQYFQDNPSQ